jgi:hypothetical protein
MDMIGKINPPSSKGHQFILTIIDYFTKWVEAVPMKSVASKDVINFVKEHVIHRFGIPRTIKQQMEVRSSFQRSSRSSPPTWASSRLGHLHIMPKQMDKLKHPIRALSS